MRIVVDEDIPKELVPFFGAPGILVEHVEDAQGVVFDAQGIMVPFIPAWKRRPSVRSGI